METEPAIVPSARIAFLYSKGLLNYWDEITIEEIINHLYFLEKDDISLEQIKEFGNGCFYRCKKLIKEEYALNDFEAPIFHFLKKCCYVEAYMDLTQLHAVLSDEKVSKALEMPVGSPLLNMEEVDRTSARTGKDSFINGIGKNGEELISLFEIGAIIDEKDVV